MKVRNNIFTNTYNSTFTTTGKTDANYAIYCLGSAAGGFLNIDYNDYYVGGTGNIPILGFLGGTLNTLYDLQLAFGQNLNSINFQPQFAGADDLHLVAGSVNNAALNNYGQPIAGITVDIDNQVRNVLTPDIGAD